jgi:hypothetical protein
VQSKVIADGTMLSSPPSLLRLTAFSVSPAPCFLRAALISDPEARLVVAAPCFLCAQPSITYTFTQGPWHLLGINIYSLVQQLSPATKIRVSEYQRFFAPIFH